MTFQAEHDEHRGEGRRVLSSQQAHRGQVADPGYADDYGTDDERRAGRATLESPHHLRWRLLGLRFLSAPPRAL